jgi:peptidoglycan/xylan/chitin deacetylase (PgdA/CDA1 family)
VLDDVESLGYRVVHWRFPSGDPVKNISVKKLVSWVIYKVKPGDILIFHINGRGYRTAEGLPLIVKQLKEQGYRFVKLNESIK